MKSAILCFILCAAAVTAQPRRPAQQRPQPQPQNLAPEDYGRVEGVIIQGQTGEPLRKVEVQLNRTDARSDDDDNNQTANTAEDGKFSFPRVAPGRYGVRVTKTGFTRQGSGWSASVAAQQSPLQLSKGQAVTGMTIKMLPHGVITGRVLDEDAEPVPRVSVSAYHYTYSGGRKSLSTGPSATTNDLGEFRLWGLTPGAYYLGATPFEVYNAQAQRRKTKAETFAPTFFPSVDLVERSTPIEVAAGSQTPNMDIRLRKTRTFSVSGTIVDGASGAPWKQRASVILSPNTSQGEATGGGRGSNAATRDGKFSARGLAPGSYTAHAMVFAESSGSYVGTAKIEIQNEDIEGLAIAVQPNATMPVSLKYEGSEPPAQAYVRVMLESAGIGYSNGMAGGSSKDGPKFSLPNVGADRYRIRVTGIPDGFYLRNVQLGNQDVRFTGLDFTVAGAAAAAASELVLTFAAQPGSIEGSVKNGKDELVAGATVLLIPKEEWTGMTDQIRTAKTAAQGDYQFAALAPGEYEIYAFEEIEDGAWFDPEVRKRFHSEAKTVKVEKGSPSKMELRAARP